MPRVLVVGDAPEMADAVASELQRAGHDATAARDLSDALAADAVPPFDVIVWEPAGSGKLAEAWLAGTARRRPPVVVFTTALGTAARRHATRVGAAACLIKGEASAADLVAAVERAAQAWPVGLPEAAVAACAAPADLAAGVDRAAVEAVDERLRRLA